MSQGIKSMHRLLADDPTTATPDAVHECVILLAHLDDGSHGVYHRCWTVVMLDMVFHNRSSYLVGTRDAVEKPAGMNDVE